MSRSHGSGWHSLFPVQNVSDRTPSSLLYRVIDTIQTTGIAAAAWTYLIRHYENLQTATKMYPYVYCPTSFLFLSGLSTFYASSLTVCIYAYCADRVPDLPIIDCRLLYRAFRAYLVLNRLLICD